MNVTGHIAVAAGISDDPRVLLGAALPDLATFGGHRLLRQASDPAIAEGIRLHHRTDDAFHGCDWFRSRQRRLRADLDARGVSRGAARAAAHVGPEMMIDGTLLDTKQVREQVKAAFAELTVAANNLDDLVDAPTWPGHLAEVQSRGLPTDYSDPHAVAKRLERILRRRPRLALDPNQIPDVAEALSVEAAGIAATTHELVEQLVIDVKDA